MKSPMAKGAGPGEKSQAGIAEAEPRKSQGPEKSVKAKLAAKKAAWARSPAILKTSHVIIQGDSRSLPELDSESAHLVLTSPPYWDLKEYREHPSQLGHIHTYGTFHAELDKVWQECFRALVPGGRMCVVVGDVCRSRKLFGRHQVIPLHGEILRRCAAIGFETLAPIIWYKIANAVTEVAGNGTSFLGKPYEPNAIIKNDIEYILLLRKPGYRKPSPEQRDLSVIDPADYAKWFRQIWEDVPGAAQREHPAPFPQLLAERLIAMFSFVGDTVVDPFLGSGTTTLAAIATHRSSIGSELDPHYVRVIKRRLEREGLLLGMHGASVEFTCR